MVLEVAEEFEAIVVTICWIRCNYFVDGLAANVVFGTNSLLMSLSFKAKRFSNGVLVRDNHNGSKTTWNPDVEVRSKCINDVATSPELKLRINSY